MIAVIAVIPVIAMMFIIEFDIGLSVLLQAALPLLMTARETNSSS